MNTTKTTPDVLQQQLKHHLSTLKADEDSLKAAEWLPYFQQYPEQLDTHSQLPDNIKQLLKKTLSIAKLHLEKGSNKQDKKFTENFRKLILTLIEDERAIILKIVEQLVRLELAKYEDSTAQQRLANNALNFYAPLANRLGVGQLKWQLEDWAFRYLHPEDYQRLSKALNMRRTEREHFITTMIDQLQGLIDHTHIKNTRIYGRAKHIYSIYLKLKRKTIEFDQIYDASALRVLVPTVQDCYAMLGIVHAHWQHVAAEFDDYIANPKPNGYQSIHTAVLTDDNRIIEIQIRTHEMHQQAEYGIAAHWAYKENKNVAASQAQWLKRVAHWEQELQETPHIYVFSPQGDIIDLPQGATPLDFAYHIHTSLGHRCRGAKVNGKLTTLNEPLQTGDQVEIMTQREPAPSRDWLNPEQHYLATPRARKKVLAWFKKQRLERDYQRGLQLWEKATHHKSISKTAVQQLLKQMNFLSFKDLLVAIGNSELGANSLVNQLLHSEDATPAAPAISTPMTPPKKNTPMAVAGFDNVLTNLAKCCKPIPGDAVKGYISQGRGVIIHRQMCPNLSQLNTLKPDQIIDVNWETTEHPHYTVELKIISHDNQTLLKNLTPLLAQEKVNLLSLNTLHQSKQQRYHNQVVLQLNANQSLSQFISKIKQIDQSLSISRI